MRMRFLLIFLLFVSCTDAQVTKILLKGKTAIGAAEFPALSGEATFSMDDIPLENIPDLYISYDIPAGENNALLVYVHGWSGGGGIDGGIDPAAISYLHSQGIGILGVGMRGRNTGVDYANDGTDLVAYRDAGALENYDVYASIKHFIENVVPTGQIDKSRISAWVISGGGGAGAGCANKFPGLFSTDILWYAISKYGTYDTDPLPSLTSWYTDNDNYEGQIQGAIGSPPKGEGGYTAGNADEYYISRDHITGIGNSPDTKFHIYHDTGDGVVFDDLSDALTAKMLANGQDYEYHHSSNGDYDHDQADLIVGNFSLSPQFGLHWVTDVQTVTRTEIPNSGSLFVPGYVIPLDSDLEPIFSFWIKTLRKNNPASPSSQARLNQGKASAATLNYNLTNNTFQTQLVKGNTSAGDQFKFVDITHGSNHVMALLATNDVVTLEPTTWNTDPVGLSSYDWKYYVDFSSASNYLLDDQSKVSNAWDLTGNSNFMFQEVRATRASIVSGSLDNGIIKNAGTVGTLNTNVDVLTLTGELTIAFAIDPDAASIGSLSGNIIGKGAGSQSLVQLGNFSGKVQVLFNTESNNGIFNATPSNSNVGKQVWVIRRDASNNVVASCKNSSGTFTYTVGTSAGSFIPKVLGSGASSSKEFSGKIYKAAVSDDRLSDVDVTTLLDTWYAGI